MRQFFTFVFAFMLTTILVVAVPHGDYSLNDQKASGAADVQEMNPEPDVVDTAPETVALTDQKTSLIAPDSDNTDENNPGIEFASNSSPAPESKDPETGGTSVTPSKEFPDTPVRANCAVGAVDWFPVFQCPLDTTLFNRGYGTAGIASTPLPGAFFNPSEKSPLSIADP